MTLGEWLGGLLALATGFLAMSRMLGSRIDELKGQIAQVQTDVAQLRVDKRIDDLKEHMADRVQDLRHVTSERIQDLKEVLGSRR